MHKSEGAAVHAAAPDLLYVVKPGEYNEELRFSLRSVAENLPHRKVWIAGYVPAWVRGVERIPLDPLPEQYPNMRQSAEAALAHPELSERFVLLNDDHFALSPVEDVTPYHQGSIRQYIEHLHLVGKDPDNPWFRAVRETADWMGGDPNVYECHTPLPFSKTRLSSALRAYPRERDVCLSTLYPVAGNGGDGARAADTKVACTSHSALERKLAEGLPLISTTDRSFARGAVGEFVRSRFPRKCRYEA